MTTTINALDTVGAPTRSALDPQAGGPLATRDVPMVVLPTGGDATSSWRIPTWLERLAGVIALIAIWELASRVGWLSPRTLAGPSTVLTAGRDLVADGTLPEALWTSLQRVGWGLAIGVPLGVGLALLAGLTRAGDALIDANVHMLRFVPIIALQPLLIVWLGIGESVKVFLIMLGVAFPIYVNTSNAIRSIHPGFHELADVAGLGRAQRIRRIVLPGALPGFLVGFRLATAVAWLILVFAEQINASSGLGYMMLQAQTFFQTDVLVVGLVVYATLGLICDALIRALERGLLRWQPGR